VGAWKQVWKDGKLESWRPLSEILVTAAAPLFDDITDIRSRAWIRCAPG
jgi:hypothetical protein